MITSIFCLFIISQPSNITHLSDLDLRIPKGPVTAAAGDYGSTFSASDRIVMLSQLSSGIISVTPSELNNRNLIISRLPQNLQVGSRSLFYMKDSASSEFVFTNQSRTYIYYADVSSGYPAVNLKACGPFEEISDIHLTEDSGVLSYLVVSDAKADRVYSYVLDPSGSSLCTTQQSLTITNPQWIQSLAGNPATVYIGSKDSGGLKVRSFQASNLAAITASQTITETSRAQFGKVQFDATSSELIIPIQYADDSNGSDYLIRYASTLASSTIVSSCRFPVSTGIDYEGATRYRYTFCPSNQKIQIRDTSDTLLQNLSTGSQAKQMIVGSDATNRFISVLQKNGKVLLHQILISTGVVTTTTITLPGNATGIQQFIGAGATSDQLVATIPELNAISIVNLSAQTLTTTVYLPRAIDHAVSPSSSLFYFSNSSVDTAYELTELNSYYWSLELFPVGDYPVQVGYRTGRLYVLNRDSANLSIINLTTRATTTISTGTRPIAFDFDTTSNRLWAINETSQSITVLDITVGSEATAAGSPVSLGFTPKKIVYHSSDTTLFAGGGTTIRTINAPTLATVTSHSLSSSLTDMTLTTAGVTASSKSGNALFLATRTTISTTSLSSSPHFLTSNGAVASAGQLQDHKISTSSGLSREVPTFDRLLGGLNYLATFSIEGRILRLFPVSLLSSSNYPNLSLKLEFSPDRLSYDSSSNLWLYNSDSLEIVQMTSLLQLSILRNETLNRPEAADGWDAQDKLYIALRNLNALAIVNAVSGTVSLVSVCQSPRQVLVDSSQSPTKVFVLCPESNLISVVNVDASGDFTSHSLLSTGNFPTKMGIATDPINRLYTINRDDSSASVFNTVSLGTVATTTISALPSDLTVLPSSGLASISHEGSSLISQITSAGALSTLSVGTGEHSMITQNTSTSRIFSFSRSTSNSLIYPSLTLSLSGTAIVTDEVASFSVTNSTLSKTYVTYPSANAVRVFDEAGILSDISVGEQPSFVSVLAAISRAYISNRGGDSLTVVNTSTNAVVTTVSLPTGCEPGASHFLTVSGTTYLYVLCQKTDEVIPLNTTNNSLGTSIDLR